MKLSMKKQILSCSRSVLRWAASGGLALAGLAFVAPGRADILYWDGPDTTANGVVDGGYGIWDTTTANWTTTNGTPNFVWDNAAGLTNVARFEASAGTVSMLAPITAGGLSFSGAYVIETSGYDLTLAGTGLAILGNSTARINGPGNLLLASNQTWTNNTKTLVVAAAVNTGPYLLTLETRDNAMDVTGIISGTGGLTIKSSQTSGTAADNNGSPTLNTANDYTGTTTMIGGYIWLNSGGLGALGADTSDVILNGGGFRLTGSAEITRGLNLTGICGISKASGTTALLGPLTGAGTFNASGNFGAGAVLVLGVANGFTGDLRLGSDITVRITNAQALGLATLDASTGARSAVDFTNASLSYVIGGLKGTNSVNLGTGLGGGGDGTVTIGNNDKTSVYSGALTGAAGVTKIGTGTLTFAGTNLYTGNTRINTGTLKLGVPTQTLTFALSGTTTAQRRVLTGLASTADLYAGQLVTGAGVAANTVITFVDSPTQVSVNNAVTAGTTSATFAGRSGALAGSPGVSVASGAILDVANVTDGFAIGAGQALGGSGTVVGGVTVANNSTLSPGSSIGTLTNSGNVTWQGGGTLKWELSSTNASGQDLLLVAGALNSQATSGNKFKISIASLDTTGNSGPLSGGFNPNVDQSWKLVTASGGVTGFSADAFTFVDNFTTHNGGSGTFEVGLAGNDLLLKYKAAFVPEPPVAGSPNPASAIVWIGEAASFTINASGTAPLSYQWRHNGAPIADATTSVLSLSNLQQSASGNYECIVSSPYPPASTSSVAVLTVNRLVTNGCYRLGEAGVGENNRPVDSSGWGHDFAGDLNGAAVTVGTATPAPGSSQYYEFGGTAGFSGIGWNPPEDNVGVECWVRVSDLGQTAQVFGSGTAGLNGLNLLFSGGALRAAISTSGLDSTVGTPYVPLGAAEWVHVAVVRQNGVTRFYVNGLPAGPSANGAPVDATAPFLGRANTARTFTGAIDEARIFTFAPGQFQLGDLGFYQGVLPGELHPKPWFSANATADFYVSAKAFASYSGWWDLWYRYRGALPFGDNVTAAQVENSVPDTNAFPDKRFTLDPADAIPDTDGHAETVGRMFYGNTYFEDSQATFEYGFGRHVNDIAAYTSGAFRENVLHILPFNTRDGSLPAWNHGRRDVLNLSNSMGNGGEDNTIRALDYLIDVQNLLAFTAMPGSYVGENNGTLSGNLWNSLVIAQNGPRDANWNGAQYERVGTNFRVKPDLVSSDSIGGRTGGASSWTTPTVAGAAAFLLEAARMTLTNHAATNNYVLKSVLMAGASKQGLVSPVWAGDNIVDWDSFTPYTYSNNAPAQPLDRLFGAGLFNLNNSWSILTAGEQSLTATNGAFGWARGTGLTSSTAQTYWFALGASQREFVALLAWNRHIQDNAGTSYNWSVTDLKLELYNAASQLLASSDDPGNNIEQVYLAQGMPAGLYYLKVSSPSATPESYGLAWRGVAPTAVAEPVAVAPQSDGSMKVVCQGAPLATYKLFRCLDLTWNIWEEVGTGMSDANGVLQMTDPFPPADKAFYRAQFTY
jgi:autotransporter-associated beta strand protein